jgi:hypothetical protein
MILKTEHCGHRPDLVLPDGRPASSLRLIPLRAALLRLKIPGITAEMGKEKLLDAYEATITATVQAMRLRTRPDNGRAPKGLSQTETWRAAVELAQAVA